MVSKIIIMKFIYSLYQYILREDEIIDLFTKLRLCLIEYFDVIACNTIQIAY